MRTDVASGKREMIHPPVHRHRLPRSFASTRHHSTNTHPHIPANGHLGDIARLNEAQKNASTAVAYDIRLTPPMIMSRIVLLA
jgi:hypothetical protein